VKFAFFLMTTAALMAQPLRVYSEFARLGASGEVVSPAEPREILSPAIARNGFSSFQIVVQVAKGTRYWLYVGQNPEDSVKITLYRVAEDRLEPVDIPYQGDQTQVFWMDLWADGDAPVRRIKVEPQLNLAGDWVIYPMEVRVMSATIPKGRWPDGSAAPSEVMRSFLCGTKTALRATPEQAAGLRFRNAQQDVALARQANRDDLLRLLGGCEARPPEDPEWYLRVRDHLLRLR
jgi:hypothetical protein